MHSGNRQNGLFALLGLALLFGSCKSNDRAPGQSAPSAARPAPTAAPPFRPLVVDMHVHLSPHGLRRLDHLMGQYHFDHVVNLSGGSPATSLAVQLQAAQAFPGRITVFASLAYEEAERAGYGKRMAESLRLARRMGARGLKIAKVLGLGLVNSKGKLIAVDDKELDPVFEAAGELDMPVAIHAGDPKAFWNPIEPRNERYAELEAHPGWALYGRDVPSFDELQSQLERRVARHPKTTFISVHFGNCAEEPERVARLLRTYPNLYIDTAARIPEIGRQSADRMRAFYLEFQDRIVYGSDLGVGPEHTPLFLGSEGAEPPTPDEERLFFSATRRYFETRDRDFAHPTPIQGAWKISGVGLPRSVLEKIYAKNALRLLHLEVVPHR